VAKQVFALCDPVCCQESGASRLLQALPRQYEQRFDKADMAMHLHRNTALKDSLVGGKLQRSLASAGFGTRKCQRAAGIPIETCPVRFF